jgi:hypothetical protein
MGKAVEKGEKGGASVEMRAGGVLSVHAIKSYRGSFGDSTCSTRPG